MERWLIREKRSTSIEQIQGEMCANLFLELTNIANSTLSKNNNNAGNQRDLFLEMRKYYCIDEYSKLQT